MFIEITDYQKLLMSGKLNPTDTLNGIMLSEGAKMGIKSYHFSIMIGRREYSLTFDMRTFPPDKAH